MRSPVHSRLLVPVTLAGVVALSACGGGSSSSSPTTSTARAGERASVTYVPAGANPSVSAKMVCKKEVRGEIAAVLNVHEKRVTTPTWANHIYSCTYVYPSGSIVLSVKELVSAETTTAYFNRLEKKLGRAETLNGLAQGAFVAKNNDVVVRKDYKVLLVDVHSIPATFLPGMSRSDVATNIAAAIMGCWTGA